MKKGFTLIEVLIVIGIMAIIAGVTAVSFSSFNKTEILNRAKGDSLALFARARSESLSAKAGSVYGIQIGDTTLTFFENTYSAGNPENYTLSFQAPLVISTTSIGGNEVLFEKLTGRTSNTGYIVLNYPPSNSYATVTISSLGIAE